jgi:glycosyltransferase involved in cell wall biosynthesis
LHKKFTVLQVLPALDSGGVEIGTLSMVQALVEAGHQALVVSAGGQLVTALETLGGLHITLPLTSKNPLIILHNIRKLRKIIATYKVELVHARSRAPAWSAFFACKKEKCPFITTVHGAYKTKGALKKYYNSVMMRGDRIIAISEFIERYIQESYQHLKGVNLQHIKVIHRGVDSKIFDPEVISQARTQALALQWQLPLNTPLILLPARLSPSKGHIILLKALTELPHKNFLCLLIGSDQGRLRYRSYLEEQIIALDLQHKVRIVDYCTDMAAAYKVADMVINPSIVPEAFGRVIVEAQAMCTPIIASELGAPIDLISQGKTGWLFPEGNVHKLSQTIQNVLDLDEATKRKVGLEARNHVVKHYTNTLMCQKTLELYYQVIEKKQT